MMKTLVLTLTVLLLVLKLHAQVPESSADRWMPLGLPAHIEEEARKTGVSYEKIHNYLKRNFHKLIDNVGNVVLESEEFGLDHLIVAKLVFGLQRKVEKNPWPKGDEDQFLLKDEMTIGFRLGAGLVVLGDIGIVKKYTLVRPMRSHREAIMANDFIVDLFLPLKVQRLELPEKYVLITENTMEGRGRLKLGGGIMINPFVHQTHRSKVTLSRTFIDQRDDNIMKVFIDVGDYIEWGQLLYITNGFLSYTLFTGAIQNGEIHRRFFEIDRAHPSYYEAFFKLVVQGDFTKLSQFASSRQIHDRFRQSTAELGLFGINSNSRNRYDEISEYENNADGELVLVNEQVQSENERERGWFTFISGEEYFSNILFMANRRGEEIEHPHAIITTRINDKKANIKEFEDKYLASLKQIALVNDVMSIDEDTREMIKEQKPRMIIDTKIIIGEEAIESLLEMTSEQYWAEIKKVTGIDQQRFEEAAKMDATSSVIRTKRDPLRSLAIKLRSIERKIKKIAICEDIKCKVKEITRILRDATYVSGGKFEGQVMAILHAMFKNQVSIDSQIGMVNEGRVVESLSWKNDTNIRVPQKHYRFNFELATQIYHLFDINP